VNFRENLLSLNCKYQQVNNLLIFGMLLYSRVVYC